MALPQRRLPVGAEILPSGEAHFRVWAPRRRAVELALEGGGRTALSAEGGGYFSGTVREARAGALYKYRLDGGESYPDPASRYQPQGPDGPSQVIDPAAYRWRDGAWKGLALPGQVLYEMHVGTFTKEGTWEAAARELPALARPGRDGGRGHARRRLRRAVRLGLRRRRPLRAHAPLRHAGRRCARSWTRRTRQGLGVILDVVYNHLGPSGNYLPQFSERYFSDKYGTEWGEPFNYDGEDSAPVREFIVANAGYWITEFHLDGLRLDATQSMHDASPEHVLAAIAREARARGRPALHHPRGGERAAADAARASAGAGRLRHRRALERRLPPQRDGGPDRPQRGVLQRLPRYAPGARLRPQVRLPLSGPALPLARQAPRDADASAWPGPRS